MGQLGCKSASFCIEICQRALSWRHTFACLSALHPLSTHASLKRSGHGHVLGVAQRASGPPLSCMPAACLSESICHLCSRQLPICMQTITFMHTLSRMEEEAFALLDGCLAYLRRNVSLTVAETRSAWGQCGGPPPQQLLLHQAPCEPPWHRASCGAGCGSPPCRPLPQASPPRRLQHRCSSTLGCLRRHRRPTPCRMHYIIMCTCKFSILQGAVQRRYPMRQTELYSELDTPAVLCLQGDCGRTAMLRGGR